VSPRLRLKFDEVSRTLQSLHLPSGSVIENLIGEHHPLGFLRASLQHYFIQLQNILS
jgi:hypothetical protein